MSKRLDQDYYTQLSAWAESDAAAQAVVRATPVRASDATRAQMLAMLTDATADDPAGRQLLHRAAGRPSLSAGEPAPSAGESPQWKVRAPRALDADVRAVAAREGRTVSDVLRAAAAAYVAAHRAS